MRTLELNMLSTGESRKRILVIAPHADDEIFGCGGTLMRLKHEGHTIQCVLVACDDIEMRHIGLVNKHTRADEFSRSCELLSNQTEIVYYMKDSMLDQSPLSALVSKLDKLLDSFKPDIMFIPEPSYHQDHQYVNRACIAALRPTKTCLPSTVYEYEVPTSTWGSDFKPNVFFTISEDLVKRKEDVFVNCYKTQAASRADRGKLSTEVMLKHAMYRGLECGSTYAEAFRVLREVK